MIPALSRLRGAAFIVAISGVSVAASGQCFAQSSVVVHSGTHSLLRQQLAIQQQTLTALQVLQGQVASLINIENSQRASTATPPRLSLAGCSANGHIFPKGATQYLSSRHKEICADAIAGKPTYGLAWHLVSENSIK